MTDYRYTTPNCPTCGESEVLTIPLEGLRAYNQGALLQDAFPTLSPEVREQIKTGWHAKCWDLAMGPDPEDDAEEMARWSPVEQGMYDDDPSPYGGTYSEE